MLNLQLPWWWSEPLELGGLGPYPRPRKASPSGLFKMGLGKWRVAFRFRKFNMIKTRKRANQLNKWIKIDRVKYHGSHEKWPIGATLSLVVLRPEFHFGTVSHVPRFYVSLTDRKFFQCISSFVYWTISKWRDRVSCRNRYLLNDVWVYDPFSDAIQRGFMGCRVDEYTW